jgi:glucose/arabinose dehydrogenase
MIRAVAALLLAAIFAMAWSAMAQERPLLTGRAALGDWRDDRPGVRRRITVRDLPGPFATPSARNPARVDSEWRGRTPLVPPGFSANLFASGLDRPRLLRTAPNGDVFVAEGFAGRVRVLRPSTDNRKADQVETFAAGLNRPFGINFYPPGPNPQWVYVANTDSVVRFAYRNGDLKARSAPEVVVPALPSGGHWTRDIAFSSDGQRMFVSVGSRSNVAEHLGQFTPGSLGSRVAGLLWGDETDRAAVLAFDADGKKRSVFATGLRNCVGMVMHPRTGDLWCSVNERDGLGDNLVPDYVTRVREGAFYGWPWFYLGANEDPRHKAARPDLREQVVVPDVLIASHSAPLQMVFYDGRQFPPGYRGDAFVALQGSWNRAQRTGYKIVRVPLKNGVATGEYEDFVTGFVLDDSTIWARLVGITVARDGALLFSDDGNGTIWRVSYQGRR